MSTPDPLDYGNLIDQSTATAEQSAGAAWDPLISEREKTLGSAQEGYQQTVAGMQAPPPVPAFDDPVPKNHFADISKASPWLFALAALGGKVSKASGMQMLGALTGMQQGLVQGNQQAYQESRQKYADSYRAWLDHWKALNDNYKMYLEGYKGRIDASRIAWEKAQKSVDDAQAGKAKAYGDAKAWAHIATGIQNANTNLERADTDSVWKHQQAILQQEKIDAAKAKAATKKAEHAKSTSDAVSQIDALIAQIEKDPSVTGAMGYATRALEVGKTATGLGSQATPSHTFQSGMDALLLQVPKLLTGSSKSAKDERARVDDIANALKLGSTGPIAKAKLEELKSILQKQKPDDEVQVQTAEEAMALEPGTHFVTPDGRHKIR